jgi:trigger factor
LKIDQKELGALHSELTITIEKEDYLQDYKSKLASMQAKSHLKGFRKGKAPKSILVKMYGAGAMQEVVSEILSKKINELITDSEFNIIGEPLFLDEDNPPVIDHLNPTDYSYRFEIGTEPDTEIKGVSTADTFTLYKIEVSEDSITEELDTTRKKMGKQESTDSAVTDGDIIYLKAQELDGKAIKEGGVESTFAIQVDSTTEEYKSKLIGSKKGDKMDIDLFKLEEGMAEENVYKYFLKLSEDQLEDTSGIGKVFATEITDVVRTTKAELDQEFFDKYFGKDEVKSEEEAREKVRGYMSEFFEKEAKNYQSREIMEKLMVNNNLELPTEFLRKWINRSEEMDDEKFESFQKELKWSLIKKKLVKQHEVKVEEKEIFDYFVNAVRSYSPYMDESSLKNTVFSLMQNREQLNKAIDVLSTGKLFDVLQLEVTSIDESISKDDFYEKVKSLKQ